MTPTTDTYMLLRAFVDELARCGMRAACTSPGSRNTPLVLSLAGEERLRCYSHIDERCAGFFALGLAKASGLPVAVTCTSGTAAAELLPAAVEAREARVPLLVLSADRPAELRENGAGQAIDQLKLFGSAAKWFFEVAVHEAGEAQLRWMRTLACRAYWTALQGTPGVVHLNFPLREPLVSEEPLPPDNSHRASLPFVNRETPMRTPAMVAPTFTPDRLPLRGVLVAGRYERSPFLAAVASAFAERLGWPLLADPMSGARRSQAAIAHYDALLRDRAFADSMRPQIVVRVGDLPVSKPLRSWLAGLADVPQLALDDEGAWQDPDSVVSSVLSGDPASTLRELLDTFTPPPSASSSVAEDWLEGWRSADERASEAILGALGDDLSEPRVAAELGALLPARATLFVASSMPVREIETFWPVRADPPRVLCNRGANGIDGTVSSAFGVAAHDRDAPVADGGPVGGANPVAGGGPVVLLIGDVALAYDIGGLLAARRLGLRLTIVLIDNGGGGIFDFLPIARASMGREPDQGAPDADEDIYTRHVSTPTGLDFAAAAALYGLDHELAGDVGDFRAALERALESERSSIVEVRTSRERNVELHREVWAAVSAAISPQAGGAAPAA
jgi:2-succinyl-5-enolpyruvyl-6-hydroxy-3-cyclohexene-1-carboxylate synthase